MKWLLKLTAQEMRALVEGQLKATMTRLGDDYKVESINMSGDDYIVVMGSPQAERIADILVNAR